jgi:hypothetical protein
MRTRIFAETDITLFRETLINNWECFYIERVQKRYETKFIMAFDTFIKIVGIEGKSTDDKHAGWIMEWAYAVQKRQAGGWDLQKNCKV